VSNCWICEGDVVPSALFSPEPFVECRSCRFAFRPELAEATLKEVYSEGAYEEVRGEQYLREQAARRRDARVRLQYLRPWARSGRLLDVGAAGGAFVAEAMASGFEASGIEPVPSFARAARDSGLDVREGSIQDVPLAERSLDAITLWHVLEHLPRPLAQVLRLAEALNSGGVLAVEVPNAGSAVALRMRASWPSLEPDVHVNQFTPDSLRSLLERAGLALCDLRTTTITPYLPVRARFAPRHLAGRTKAALWLRDPRVEHRSGHELLRAVGRRP
jgi:SAM-dependent methyltransferase